MVAKVLRFCEREIWPHSAVSDTAKGARSTFYAERFRRSVEHARKRVWAHFTLNTSGEAWELEPAELCCSVRATTCNSRPELACHSDITRVGNQSSGGVRSPRIASASTLPRPEAPLAPEILHLSLLPGWSHWKAILGRFHIQIDDLTLNDLILRLVRELTTDREGLKPVLVGHGSAQTPELRAARLCQSATSTFLCVGNLAR